MQNLTNITDRFASLNDLNRQISSGRIADTFQDLNGVVEQVSSFETRIERNENFIRNNDIVRTRLNATNDAIGTIQDILESFRSTISITNLSDRGSTLEQNGEATIQQVLDQLNSQVAGRHLFAGSRTNIPPVSNPPVTLEAGVADANYYNGNSDIITCLLYTSPSPRDQRGSRMPSSA